MGRSWRSWAADPRAVDAAVVLLGLALTVLAVRGRWAPWPRPVIAVAGVAGSLAQWPRRRRPWLAALAGSVAYALSGNPAPLVTGLGTAAVRAPRWQVPLLGLA